MQALIGSGKQELGGEELQWANAQKRKTPLVRGLCRLCTDIRVARTILAAIQRIPFGYSALPALRPCQVD